MEIAESVVVGPIGHVTEGQHLLLTGKWVEHATHGRQFRVRSVLVEDPRTTRGLERYLGSGAVTGLGKEFAKRVVATFGLDTLQVIEEEPKRLLKCPVSVKREWNASETIGWQTRNSVRCTPPCTAMESGVPWLAGSLKKYGEKSPIIICRKTLSTRGRYQRCWLSYRRQHRA